MKKPAHFVDSHHHLWDLDHCHYPWLMEKGVKRFFGDPAPIQKNYLPGDLTSDFGELPVHKSVHIQVGVDEADSVKETQWVQQCSDEAGFPSAIIAFCDLRADNLEQILDQHAASPNFRGVRQIVGRSAEEDAKSGTATLLEAEAFARGLSLLAKRGMSFDLQLTPPLMSAAAKLFAKIDGLQIALCHAGSPSDFSAEGMQHWQAGLKQLAAVDGLICKLSGFGMFNHGWTTSDVEPMIHYAIDLFGPERIAFGSNFPVDKLYVAYDEMMHRYLAAAQRYTQGDIDQVFCKTAERFYSI